MMHDLACVDAAASSDPDVPLVAPSVMHAMLRLCLLKLSLGVIGFRRTWHWIQVRSLQVPLSNGADGSLVTKAEYRVAMAAALYPGRAECLERSLLLFWYLRRRGVDVRFRMGIQMYPFTAHAWVELCGRPVNDVPEHVRRFRPIVGIGA